MKTCSADPVADAVRALLLTRRPPGTELLISQDEVLVPGLGPVSPDDPVVAAVDDDENPGPILRYAADEARRLRVPLRAVHIWTRRSRRDDVRSPGHHRMAEVDQFLSQVLYDHLSTAEADAAEREILYHDAPAPALITLSRTARLIVLARASSGHGATVGSTAGGLIGRTYCPLALLAPGGAGPTHRVTVSETGPSTPWR